MGPLNAHASFSFAQYIGKSGGDNVIWLAFWGTYTLTFNVEMLRLLIDSIDDGQPADGFEDDTYDLVTALEDLMPPSDVRGQGDTKAIATRLFSLSTFNNTLTIQCRVEGLELLTEAVGAGANYDGEGGTSLYAFTGQAEGLVAKEKARKQQRAAESDPPPVGYVSTGQRRRRRESV